MMSSVGFRQALGLLAVATLAACSQGGSSPAAPTAVVSTVSANPAGGGVEIVEGSAVKPEGFETVIFSDPKRDENGEIHGDSGLTVEYDACRSSAGDGHGLHYYFDWDFDHVANTWGTGDACLQKHTYRASADGSNGDERIRTNVCVTNGDLQRHDAATYVSCREFTIVLARTPVSSQPGPCTDPPVSDFFGSLQAIEGSATVVGNVTVNDCPGGIVTATGFSSTTNVATFSLSGNGDVSVTCAAGPGNFSFSWGYTNANGSTTFSGSGTCVED